MSELTYEDYKSRVNIQDLLVDAGYTLNRRDGLRYPSYVRLDGDGRRIHGDKFIVTANGKCCFQPPVQKNYNVLSFIKEHPTFFQDYKPGMSLDRLVHLVCHRILNQPMEERTERTILPQAETKTFNLDNYKVHRFDLNDWDSQKRFYPFFVNRGIDLNTQKAFYNHFFLASCIKEEKASIANLAFQMTIPGQDGIVGLEERGRATKDGKSFKGKAAGSNSSDGLWIANLEGRPLSEAHEVAWFESAYDAMAYYQLNPDDRHKVYVSTGGTPTVSQMRGMIRATPKAAHSLCFDADLAGRQFVINFVKTATDMGVSDDRIERRFPEGDYKDWNEALLSRNQEQEQNRSFHR